MLRGTLEGTTAELIGSTARTPRSGSSFRCFGLESDPLRALADFLDEATYAQVARTSATHWYNLFILRKLLLLRPNHGSTVHALLGPR
jgi:hypothetical protein